MVVRSQFQDQHQQAAKSSTNKPTQSSQQITIVQLIVATCNRLSKSRVLLQGQSSFKRPRRVHMAVTQGRVQQVKDMFQRLPEAIDKVLYKALGWTISTTWASSRLLIFWVYWSALRTWNGWPSPNKVKRRGNSPPVRQNRTRITRQTVLHKMEAWVLIPKKLLKRHHLSRSMQSSLKCSTIGFPD